MTSDPPLERPEEAMLLEAFTEQDSRSIRQLAAEAGISDGRWRQVLKGSMTSGGHTLPVVAPAATLARMAYVLGVPSAGLDRAGRADAAQALEKLRSQPHKPAPIESLATQSGGPDEIDLIYASTTMTAREKLQRIRMVLQLRAQAEQEEAPSHDEASVRQEAQNNQA